ncbi:unnamed protein product [Phytomonas sp. EM1]|nr:unnamed protein product [Phytomonas sp. EM1]|eukprot:CCW63640.1 unnamed protein product [Phytomonas sp. isolate EM1]
MSSLCHAKTFRASDLTKKLVSNPPPMPDLTTVPFGSFFSPHMLTIEFQNNVWSSPHIGPLKPLELPPHASCLHYGLECFEGLKAYADIEDINKVSRGESLGTHRRLRLFRPECNVARFQSSMARLCFPSFDAAELLKLLEEFVKIEKDYVPTTLGYSLYLRPTAIGISHSLGAAPAESGMLFVIASPVGSYFSRPVGASTGAPLGAVRILVDEVNHRAWPGGIGGFKLGANYAGPMLMQREAAKAGFKQVLWLGPNREVTEIGAMNFMVVWRTPEGTKEMVTAPLDGMILPGVTRDSILSLVRGWGLMRVVERSFTIDEMLNALKEGRVIECFGCGTAAVVTPVNGLRYRGEDVVIPSPTGEESLCERVFKAIMDIQYGKMPNEWSRLLHA